MNNLDIMYELTHTQGLEVHEALEFIQDEKQRELQSMLEDHAIERDAFRNPKYRLQLLNNDR